MRQPVNVGREFANPFPHDVKVLADRYVRAGDALAHLPELHGEERQALAEVVVQFSGNPGAFVLLCADQPATKVEKALLGGFPVCDIHAGSDKTGEFSRRRISRHAGVENPAILSIRPSQAEFHSE